MELYKEILNGLLDGGLNEIVELKCYAALKKIKAIIENDDLSDEDCFLKIESIVSVFEELGSSCENRHDF